MKRKKMIRTQICITKRQKEILDEKSKNNDISISEIIRNLINESFNIK